MSFFYQVIQFIISETPPSLLPRPEREDSVVWFPHILVGNLQPSQLGMLLEPASLISLGIQWFEGGAWCPGSLSSYG